MTADPSSQPLSASECLRLLTSAPTDRIVYTRSALPAVEPVRFTLDDGHIFAAVGPHSIVPAAVHRSIAAFQADTFGDDPDRWTVTVIGDVLLVSDPAKIGKLRGMGLASWTPSRRDQFLHIRPGIVTGQRLII